MSWVSGRHDRRFDEKPVAKLTRQELQIVLASLRAAGRILEAERKRMEWQAARRARQ